MQKLINFLKIYEFDSNILGMNIMQLKYHKYFFLININKNVYP